MGQDSRGAATSYEGASDMSILPSRRSRRIRPYVVVLEQWRAIEGHRFQQFAALAGAEVAR
ncbi:Transposase [Nocardiopsis rhodophaea]